MRRTDFPQGVPGQFGVASFVWDATEDGALVAGGTVLRGEIPTGSILIGGFLHVSVALAAAVNLKLDDQVLLAASATTVGYQALTLGQLGDPTKNLVITTTARSRLIATGAIATGQFALYLFYVNNDLGEFGQATTPTLYKRRESPQALPSEIKVATFVWDAATDGPLPVGLNYLRGEVPLGSIIIGGFYHVTTTPETGAQIVTWQIGGNAVLVTSGNLPPGHYALTLTELGNPSENIPVLNLADSLMKVTVATTPVTAGQFCLYLFYVNNDVGEYGNLGQRRRTESPEARPGEMRLATWTWDAAADGPLSAGGTALNGEIPPGSILVGGFVHVATILGASVSFKLDNQVLLAAAAAAGWYELTLGKFDDPTVNVLINTAVRSRLTVTGAATTGRFVLYLFYINNELGLHGQITSPHSSQIT